MYHTDCIDQISNVLCHAQWLTSIQWLAELLKCVQILQIVFGFIGSVSQSIVVLLPQLKQAETKVSNFSVKHGAVDQIVGLTDH
jgi:hypothetical protein